MMMFIKFMDMVEERDYYLELTEDQYRFLEWFKDYTLLDTDATDYEITDSTVETFVKIDSETNEMLFIRLMDSWEDIEYFLNLTEEQYNILEWLKNNGMLDLETIDYEITEERDETFEKI